MVRISSGINALALRFCHGIQAVHRRDPVGAEPMVPGSPESGQHQSRCSKSFLAYRGRGPGATVVRAHGH